MTEENEVEAKGALVFYVNVGKLPVSQVELFMEKFKSQFEKIRENPVPKIPKNIAVFFLPVRDQDTFVDFVPFAVTEKQLLEDMQYADQVADDAEKFVHELYVGNKKECGGCCECCQLEEKTSFIKRLKKYIFGNK